MGSTADAALDQRIEVRVIDRLSIRPLAEPPLPPPEQSLSSRIQQLELATGAGTPAPGPKGEGHPLLASLQASGAGGLEAEQLMADRDKVSELQ